MKTAFEWIILDNEYTLTEKASALKKLTQISRLMPWIFDPRVKFKKFDTHYSSSYVQIFAARKFSNWYHFYSIHIYGLPSQCWFDPNRFMEYVTEALTLEPDWITIENSI